MAESAGQEVEDRLLDAIAPEMAEPQEEPVEEPVEEVATDDELDESNDDELADALADDEPEAPTVELVEVEYDGVVYEVPNTLKDALLRQSDYTQKTQGLAESRKEVEHRQKQIEVTAKEQQFTQEIQPELSNIGYLQAQIEQMTNDLASNASGMSAEDMFRKKIELDGQKEQLNALTQGLQTKYKEFEEAQKQAYEELLKEGAQILKQAIPDWSEEKQQAVRDYALSKGFSEQEVSSIVDPRHVQILVAAQQFEALKAKAKPTAAAVKDAATIQPKARPNKMDDAAKTRLKQNKIKKAKGLSNADRADSLMDTAIDRFL